MKAREADLSSLLLLFADASAVVRDVTTYFLYSGDSLEGQILGAKLNCSLVERDYNESSTSVDSAIFDLQVPPCVFNAMSSISSA